MARSRPIPDGMVDVRVCSHGNQLRSVRAVWPGTRVLDPGCRNGKGDMRPHQV